MAADTGRATATACAVEPLGDKPFILKTDGLAIDGEHDFG
ncbi:hypothetical protein ABID12_003437 [Martelella mangrovi]|uniref:Uncharacterized protein n=1 Tax=Martelella mangrovi TaxID=1397477 RepID=A0ABV2IFV6_9HYPH